MDAVASEPGVGNKSPTAIKEMMSRHFIQVMLKESLLKILKSPEAVVKKW